MKKLILTLLALVFYSVGLLADTCQNPKGAMSLAAALKHYGPEYCPGGCQSHYKIPAGSTQSIWYKGKCSKITNLSTIQPLFIPAEHEAFQSPSGTVKKHKRLGCVGDFYNTKISSDKNCHRGVQIKVESCDSPYIVEEIEKICYPGCSYIYTWDTTEVSKDKDGKDVYSVVNHSETRYFGGNGTPCTYYKNVKLMWNGINRHNPNNSKEIVTTTAHVLEANYDRISCVRPVPPCQGSAGHWICVTCLPGPGPGPGCTNKSGDWNDVDDPTGPPSPPSHAEQGGSSSTSY